MFFQSLRTYIDAEFHRESISDSFRAIRERYVGQKLKKPKNVAKLDSQVTPLSRSSPDPTVVTYMYSTVAPSSLLAPNSPFLIK